MKVPSWQAAPRADFAVIGDPVTHSLSPKMHTAALRNMDESRRYVAVHVPTGEVSKALDHLLSLGYLGINVTVPHKEAAMNWCENVEDFAQQVRAVNTIHLPKRTGINTDGPGFLETIRGAVPLGSSALIHGAGGSARAVALALAQNGYPVAILNRTLSRAKELVEAVGPMARIAGPQDIAESKLVINATSAHAKGEVTLFDWSQCQSPTVAYDLMYSDVPTPFLTSALVAHPSICCMDGKALLVAQGALALEYWLGKPAPRNVMAEAIR